MKINLKDLGSGAVDELFVVEMSKVIENILDPNTSAKPARSITINLKINPSVENRELCTMETSVSSKLAPVKSLESLLCVGIDPVSGEVDAAESVPQQRSLFDDVSGSDQLPGVVKFQKRGNEK